ncbi:MAG TPA: ABC transporter substrate-binding protein [Tepidisphaeraceae bacterium]|jgi:iron complex transport system substrate-binding protein
MNQSVRMILLALLLAGGCDQAGPASRRDGIVSLTPAGTDLLVAMGLGDRVVGVSPFEANEDLRRRLPKAGDYLHIDWETLAELRPAYLVVQGKRDRLPPGTREKCDALDIRAVILQIDRLADIEAAVEQLGASISGATGGPALLQSLRAREQKVKQHAPKARVPTLLAFSDSGTQTVGRETFIDDALTLAGGENVVTAAGYPTLDAEKLASLRPKVAFLLLPGGTGEGVARAEAALRTAGLSADVPVHAITQPDALLPGTSAWRLAEMMAAHLRDGS